MAGKHRDDEAEETVVVDREIEAETVVVERTATETTPAAAPANAAPDVDPESLAETVIVDREVDAETVIVERSDAADRTVIVERGPAGEGTVAVTRARAKAPDAGPAIPGGRRRRGMTMPPVAPGYGRGAVDAVGPGAVTVYEPREIVEPPVAPAPFQGVEATRAEAPSMPSVTRRARRAGMISLAVFAASCVVSVVGLIALGIVVFG